ncbi:hypothetical protein [Parabacteroides leei]|uniref:hypothetical protein n=1 Tax=Parabacteroides leei TaxID=2939491 RepID=UPI001899F59E|nr:hypothetical protein [Parabacteroides goldsteinii]
MNTILSIIAIILSVIAILGAILVLHVMFNLQKQFSGLNKLYRIQRNRLNPIRLHFLQMVYNDCVVHENYREAGEIRDMIKQEFPKEYQSSNNK